MCRHVCEVQLVLEQFQLLKTADGHHRYVEYRNKRAEWSFAPNTRVSRVSFYSVIRQCVAVCCSVPQCVAVCCSVLQCAAVCCSVLQCVAVCTLQIPACLVCHSYTRTSWSTPGPACHVTNFWISQTRLGTLMYIYIHPTLKNKRCRKMRMCVSVLT